MPLSKDEQRQLEEIERALRDDDPAFAATVDFEHLRRRRVLAGIATFIIGMAVLVAGAAAAQALMGVGVVVSVAGFSVMIAAAGWLLHSRRRTS